MRWIKRGNNTIEYGENIPPDGDLFFVDEVGSKAIIGGELYIDGVKAKQGTHKLTFKDGDLDLDVDAHGKTSRRKGGGKNV